MYRFRRLGRVVVIGVLGGVALTTQANAARDMVREFPQGNWCPANYGTSALESTLVFKATKRSAKLTFTSCSDRGRSEVFDPNTFEPLPANFRLALDHVQVVEKSVYDNNRLQYPEDFVDANDVPIPGREYGFDVGTRDNPTCYVGDKVDTVFNRAAAKAFTQARPFFDNFDNPANDRAWKFVNSERGFVTTGNPDDPVAGDRSIILTKKTPANQGTCGSASITVQRLVKDREYVVDFAWWVDGDFIDIQSGNPGRAAQPLVTVTFE